MFTSIRQMVKAAQDKPLWEVIQQEDNEKSQLSPEQSLARMQQIWEAMRHSGTHYDGSRRSHSGLAGGDGEKMAQAAAQQKLLGGQAFGRVIELALKVGENNACMQRIVAAPTAGSCGVLPAVLLPLQESRGLSDQEMLHGLYVAAGFGGVIAHRASIAGAEGGCQAEIGAASGMAAAALASLCGGSPEQAAHACAMALKNLLGLVCDPVAGLVEVPCVKRNVIGATGAMAAANMALAGIQSRIPPDEVIDAMGAVGRMIHPDLKETGRGGLANTPTARRLCPYAAGQPQDAE